MAVFRDGSLGNSPQQGAFKDGSLGAIQQRAFRDGSLGGCGCGVSGLGEMDTKKTMWIAAALGGAALLYLTMK
jgi:hypothetical protein